MTAPARPLTGREAVAFEDAAGITVLAAVRQLQAGDLAAAPAAAALLVVGRRRAADATLDDVHDTFPTWTELVDAGAQALLQLTDDPADETGRDGDEVGP